MRPIVSGTHPIYRSRFCFLFSKSRNFKKDISIAAMSSESSTANEERTQELLESLAEIRLRVEAAKVASSSPTLVAVSKIKPASDVLACYNDGQLDFGENYVQELEEKAKIVRFLADYSDVNDNDLPTDIRWHFIGTLQSNKAKTLASIPNLWSVQTLGLIKAATALNKGLPDERSSSLRVLIQVNTSGEDSKSGIPPLTTLSDQEKSEIVLLAKHILTQCPKLRLEGLMTIGSLELSLNASESEKNADFETLKSTRDVLDAYLRKHFPGDESKWGEETSGRLLLSMGMSSDFEAALKAGSDIVRVGTGIFGQRPKKSIPQ